MSDRSILMLGMLIGLAIAMVFMAILADKMVDNVHKAAISKGYATYDEHLNFKWKDNK